MDEGEQVIPEEKIKRNKQLDIGGLIVEDCECYENLTEEEKMDKTQANVCSMYQALFDLKKRQKLAEGEQGEFLEYTKARYNVLLPPRKFILPREKPIPKEKPLTKWEKFRLEKGITAKQKRGRMVFDPITQDWVPRYGAGSIKKIEDKYKWMMEFKPKHEESGTDPFTFARNEKKQVKEKQNLAELKNKIQSESTIQGKKKGDGPKGSTDQILDSSAPAPTNRKDMVQHMNLKQRDEGERSMIRKRERKSLMKSLQMAQISTASMGKFDKKVNKFEPDAPKSQKKQKKKSNAGLHKMETTAGAEKARNLSILKLMDKEKAYNAGGDKVKAAMDTDGMVRKHKQKQDKFNRNNKKN